MTARAIQAKQIQSKIAMTILMVSWAMFFATLFLSYFVFRISAITWPPMGMEKISLLWPLLSTLIIALSSFFYQNFSHTLQRDLLSQSKANLYLTLLFGLGFLLSQVKLWAVLKESGYYVNDGQFQSIIFGFTWIHAAHIGIGLICLLYLIFKVNFNDSASSIKDGLVVKNIGTFWHFLGVIWLLMLLGLFVF